MIDQTDRGAILVGPDGIKVISKSSSESSAVANFKEPTVENLQHAAVLLQLWMSLSHEDRKLEIQEIHAVDEAETMLRELTEEFSKGC